MDEPQFCIYSKLLSLCWLDSKCGQSEL